MDSASRRLRETPGRQNQTDRTTWGNIPRMRVPPRGHRSGCRDEAPSCVRLIAAIAHPMGGSGTRRLGRGQFTQKRADRTDNPAGGHLWKMVCPVELDELGLRGVASKPPAAFDRRVKVSGSVQDQCGYPDLTDEVSDVDVRVHPAQRHCSVRARAGDRRNRLPALPDGRGSQHSWWQRG